MPRQARKLSGTGIRHVILCRHSPACITFHDSLKSIDKLRTALPESIKWLKEQGYEFKTF